MTRWIRKSFLLDKQANNPHPPKPKKNQKPPNLKNLERSKGKEDGCALNGIKIVPAGQIWSYVLEQSWKEFAVMGVSSAGHLALVGASFKMKNIH